MSKFTLQNQEMEKLTFMNIETEPSDEMLQLIMKEVVEDAKKKMELSKKALSDKIIIETEDAQRKYFSAK